MELYLYQENTEKGPGDFSSACACNSLSGRWKNVTTLELFLWDWQKSPRGVLLSMFVTQAAVKRKQKSLSREQQDCFDEAHAPTCCHV